jgi:hypothetical protein
MSQPGHQPHRLLPRLLRLLLSLPLVAGVSCSSHRFYAKIDGSGKICNLPAVQWASPNTFIYRRDRARPFCFHRGNGEIIEPAAIVTDGGSVPKVAWSYAGFSPWDYAPAYIVHDWLYEAHRQNRAGGLTPQGTMKFYSREEADLILAEVIKTQMRDPRFRTNESPWHVNRIYWGVRRWGNWAWNKKPQPVTEDGESGPQFNPLDLVPVPHPGKTLGVIGSLLAPHPSTPDPPPAKPEQRRAGR